MSKTATKAVAKVPSGPLSIFASEIEKYRGNIQSVIPKHLTPERVIKIATGAISRNPLLLQCTTQSLIKSVIEASQLGLEIGGALGHAYLVPFKNNKRRDDQDRPTWEAQFIPGYRGLIDLARRSRKVDSIEAHVVREKDEWVFSRTDEGTKLKHTPLWEGDRGALRLVYAIARLKDTVIPVIEVMPKLDVDKIRERSKAKDNGPWVTDYEEMARKTVVRRLIKYLPMSIEMAAAVAFDERSEDHDVDLGEFEVVIEDEDDRETAQTPTSGVNGLKAAIGVNGHQKHSVDDHELTRDDMVNEIGKIMKELGLTAGLQRNQAAGRWTNDEATSIADLFKAPDDVIKAALSRARDELRQKQDNE